MSANPLDSLFKGVQTEITNLGHDAQAAVTTGLTNTAHLAASGVNAKGEIFGPLAEAFGHDPTAFVLNVARHTSKTAAKLLQRVADRTGKLSYVFNTPQGQRKVTAKPASSASANQIALTMALASLDAPATMIEEAGRMSAGLPIKPRGLNGFTVYPVALSGRGLTGEEGIERGIFGIDDAALLALVVPILGSIAVAILPGLIAAAGGIVTAVVGAVTGQPDKDKAAAAAAQQQQQAQQQTLTTAAVVGGILLVTGVGIFFAMRHKKKAA